MLRAHRTGYKGVPRGLESIYNVCQGDDTNTSGAILIHADTQKEHLYETV